MPELKDRVDAAIVASGKPAAQIARALGVDENTISRVRTGRTTNPELDLLIGIAAETGTTVGALLGEPPLVASPEDEAELLRFRGWIDGRLARIDALREPNAEVLSPVRVRQIADAPPQRLEKPFGPDANIVLRALGSSMTGAGILPGDTLYATSPDPANAWPIGSILAVRHSRGVFVKRLVSEHGRRFLISAHPDYRAIMVDGSFEVLGVVVGRVGRVG